jgi:hypothetical protein
MQKSTKGIEMRFLLRVLLRMAVATVLSVAQGRGHAATLTEPSGTWLTEDGRARVRLEHCGAAARSHLRLHRLDEADG